MLLLVPQQSPRLSFHLHAFAPLDPDTMKGRMDHITDSQSKACGVPQVWWAGCRGPLKMSESPSGLGKLWGLVLTRASTRGPLEKLRLQPQEIIQTRCVALPVLQPPSQGIPILTVTHTHTHCQVLGLLVFVSSQASGIPVNVEEHPYSHSSAARAKVA